MSTSSGNRTLASAKAAKQDEFYTQLSDIANELKHYKDHFKGKVVLCNCDDPFESNFFSPARWIAANSGQPELNATTRQSKRPLRRPIGPKSYSEGRSPGTGPTPSDKPCRGGMPAPETRSSYAGSPIVGGQLPLFEIEGLKPKGKEPYLVEINEVPDLNKDGAIGLEDVEHLLRHDKNVSRPLEQGGAFRRPEYVDILKAADIVVTNPPFSLFREYVAQLVEHGKQFLIIGSKNAITYKEVFKLIKENKLWLGVGFNAGNAYFEIPKENVRDFASGVYDEKTGLVKFRSVGWFTNMDFEERHQDIPLFKKVSPDAYPTIGPKNPLGSGLRFSGQVERGEVVGLADR